MQEGRGGFNGIYPCKSWGYESELLGWMYGWPNVWVAHAQEAMDWLRVSEWLPHTLVVQQCLAMFKLERDSVPVKMIASPPTFTFFALFFLLPSPSWHLLVQFQFIHSHPPIIDPLKTNDTIVILILSNWHLAFLSFNKTPQIVSLVGAWPGGDITDFILLSLRHLAVYNCLHCS